MSMDLVDKSVELLQFVVKFMTNGIFLYLTNLRIGVIIRRYLWMNAIASR